MLLFARSTTTISVTTLLLAAFLSISILSLSVHCSLDHNQSVNVAVPLIPQQGFALIKYYSEYCSVCSHSAPFFKQCADIIASYQLGNPNVLWTTGQVTCDGLDGALFCEHMGVKSLPTVKLYKDGKEVASEAGPLCLVELLEFVETGANLTSGTLQSALVNCHKELTDLESNEDKSHNLDGRVVEMGLSDFEGPSLLRPWFVMFHTSECASCNAVHLQLEQLARSFRERMNIGSMNCTKYADFCQTNGITYALELRFYKDGYHTKYLGPVKVDDMLSFGNQALAPILRSISIEDMEFYLRAKDIIFVYAYSSCNPSMIQDKTIASLAKKIRADVHIRANGDFDRIKCKFNITSSDAPALIVLKNNRAHVYEGDLTDLDAMYNWTSLQQYPPVVEITPQNSEKVLSAKRYAFVAILDKQKELLSLGKIRQMNAVANELNGNAGYNTNYTLAYTMTGSRVGNFFAANDPLPKLILYDSLKHSFSTIKKGQGSVPWSTGEMIAFLLNYELAESQQ